MLISAVTARMQASLNLSAESIAADDLQDLQPRLIKTVGEVGALMARIAKEKAEVVQPKAAAVAVDEAAAQAKASMPFINCTPDKYSSLHVPHSSAAIIAKPSGCISWKLVAKQHVTGSSVTSSSQRSCMACVQLSQQQKSYTLICAQFP